jgi:hypothetical protein
MIDDAISLRKKLPLYTNWLWKTIVFVLKPTMDVWPFGMRNPMQRLRIN